MRYIMTVLILVLLTANAFADTDAESIGIYFDYDYPSYVGERCFTTTAPMEEVTAYVVLTNVTCIGTIDGWVASIWTTGATPVTPSWVLSTGTDYDTSLDGFTVGIGISYFPCHSPALLARWTGIIQSPTDALSFHISGHPEYEESKDSPGYFVEISILRPLQVSLATGSDSATAMINTPSCGSVANENKTFSDVKALYR